MKELEAKILGILLRCEAESSMSHAAKEIAALIEPYQKLVEAYESLISEIDKHNGTSIWEVNLREKIEQLKNQMK